MDPGVGLLAASGLVSFILKTTLEWCVCLLLVRIANSARSRFHVWLTMLLAFAAQWIWMWSDVLRAASPASKRLPAVTPPTVGAANIAAGAGRIAIAAPIAAMLAQVMAVLLICYAVIAVWRMIGTLAARVRLARAMRHKSTPDERIATAFQEAVEQTAAPGDQLRSCELWVLPGLPSPATLGWLRPRVIVPPICQTQDEVELKAVFWHELKHVESHDALWNAVVRACRNLLWFHPCVHHAIAALNDQREMACDAAVVREHPHIRDVYASCLLRFARARDLAPTPAVAGIEMASSSSLLTERVRSILSEVPSTTRASRAWRTAVNTLLVGAMAATVPGLNILFAAEQRSAVVQIPITVDRPAPTKRHVSANLASARTQTGTFSQEPASPQTSGLTPTTLRHDEGLAAEHRAAMSILTESTGMDAPAADGGGRLNPSLSGSTPAQASPVRPSTSWSSVAIDAAARMGPLMGDHDGGDRH